MTYITEAIMNKQKLDQKLLLSELIHDLTRVQLKLLNFHQDCQEIVTNNGLLNGKESSSNGYLNGNKDSDYNPDDIPF